jgi:hypothetical protein
MLVLVGGVVVGAVGSVLVAGLVMLVVGAGAIGSVVVGAAVVLAVALVDVVGDVGVWVVPPPPRVWSARKYTARPSSIATNRPRATSTIGLRYHGGRCLGSCPSSLESL